MNNIQALAIAAAYQQMHSQSFDIPQPPRCSFYEQYAEKPEPVWVVEILAKSPFSSIQQSHSLVIGDRSAKVLCLLNEHEYEYSLDESSDSFDDDDLNELRDAGFEIL